ncbi:MAG TPA: MATE family efflux transporter [Xanthobacteraceae bacterium]|nr:MATE family efflux transporter [Xanthobacteraceae bacterium]
MASSATAIAISGSDQANVAKGPPVPAKAASNPREFILKGPVFRTLMRLSLPTLIVIMVQTLVGVVETWFVSLLGTDALAGAAVVFPVLMLMQMMANGGFGGGVASAVSRAVGAGRTEDAQALVFHAIVLGAVLGLIFTALALAGGPFLYRALGAEGGSLAAALSYSNAIFIGSIPIWVGALLAAAMRGAGQVRAPALINLVSGLVLVPLSPILIFGFGPFPAFGIAGGGAAVAIYSFASALALTAFLYSGRVGLRLTVAPLRVALFKDILGVGALSALGTIQTNLTVALVTGAVGIYGTHAIAGYGIASRLDYLLIPFLFGLGTGVITMVGTAVGAGDKLRARRVAWVGVATGGITTGVIGAAAAIFPQAWLGLFSNDPVVLTTGAQYLRIVAPFYVFFGIGMMLYFASQGADRVAIPFFGGTARLVMAGFIGWAVAALLGAGLTNLFAIVAASYLIYALICVATMRAAWGDPRRAVR